MVKQCKLGGIIDINSPSQTALSSSCTAAAASSCRIFSSKRRFSAFFNLIIVYSSIEAPFAATFGFGPPLKEKEGTLPVGAAGGAVGKRDGGALGTDSGS
jgi:hypothetical protein